MLRCDGLTGATSLLTGRGVERTWDEPLSALAWMAKSLTPEGNAPADGRWVGYLAYDLGRLFETLPAGPPDDLSLPLFQFSFHAGGEPPLTLQRQARPARR